MADKTTSAHAETGKPQDLSPQQQEERKNRILTKGTPSVVGSIDDALVIKNGDLFFLAPPDGSVPLGAGHGYGLYYHDCRYLSGYRLTLADGEAQALVAAGTSGYSAVFQLTNPDIRMASGELISKEQLGVKWARYASGDGPALEDVLTLHNYGTQTYSFPLALEFQAGFEDVFAIRGLLQEQLGKQQPPRWQDGALLFSYAGADGLERSLTIRFASPPQQTEGTTARYELRLDPQEEVQITVSLRLAERKGDGDPAPQAAPADPGKIEADLHAGFADWMAARTRIKSDSLLLTDVIERSLRDLYMLRSRLYGQHYYAAGLPWFGTLFGRDSATTCLQTLAFDRDIAAETLRLLARLQGDKVDEYKDEQPGKILHSIRVGEMARSGEIPHSPYYGSVDATPLFLILLGQHAAWTGSLDLFAELRPNVDRALHWIDQYGDSDDDGFVDYASTSRQGLVNQGWKDSGDAIVNADGSIAQPPIAPVEVQGYVYAAKLACADLFRRSGDGARADRLHSEAEELRGRFNTSFWLDGEEFYALALQKDGRPCAVPSSNPGQALWSGIVDPAKAEGTVRLLMSPEMFGGWGVRTLSSRTRRYNPVGYHLGTVWPHDNALIAAGFRRYGFAREASQLCSAIVAAALDFQHYRLPEVFAGFSRDEYGVPVHYPVACHPQAWAAGAVPALLATLLGLEPDGFNNRLLIRRPALPSFADWVELRGLRVGRGSADLRFSRAANGATAAQVLNTEGDLDVQIEGE